MMGKLNDVQKKTVNDIMSKLNKYGKCLLIRPTGFGKTKTAMDIIKKYNHIVFLYPLNSIKSAVEKYDIEGIDIQFFSHSKMRLLYKSQETFNEKFMELNQKDTLFVLDEAHFIGGPGISIVIEKLMNEICPNAKYLGLTATPKRTDKIDIKWHFFDGVVCSEYGLHEAFQDNIFEKPYYVYTPLDGDALKDYFNDYIDDTKLSKNKKKQLKDWMVNHINPQRLNIKNLDEIIGNNLDKFKNDIDYYKFILFFTTHNDIHRKKKEIVSAFKKVFPHCNINVTIVSSENNTYRLNLNCIKNLCKRENTIDLIFNVNMLTFGYHIPDITGIMMFRKTISNIIYTQQVGRCLSVIQKQKSIIFDFVENLYKKEKKSVTNKELLTGKFNKVKIDSLLPLDDIILDDQSKELLYINRLIENFIKEEFEDEVVRAYKLGLVDIDYCLNKLELQNTEDFIKILERYNHE